MQDLNKKYLDVANLHINSIKNGFLPTLGTKFLAIMYRCIDESDFTTLIVKYKDDQLIGVVSGTLGTSSLFRAMLYYPFKLVLALFPVILNPQKIKKIINIWIHMSR